MLFHPILQLPVFPFAFAIQDHTQKKFTVTLCGNNLLDDSPTISSTISKKLKFTDDLFEYFGN